MRYVRQLAAPIAILVALMVLYGLYRLTCYAGTTTYAPKAGTVTAPNPSQITTPAFSAPGPPSLGSAPLVLPNPQYELNQISSQAAPPVLIPKQSAIVWGNEYLMPVLYAGVNDEVSGVSKHIRKLMRLAKSGSIRITVDTNPADKETLALTMWNEDKGKPDVFFNTLMLQKKQQQLTEEQLEDLILAVACHEAIHLELRMPKADDPAQSDHVGIALRVEMETRAWKTTIIDVLRPMRKANRYIDPRMAMFDMALKSCNDHCNTQWYGWIVKNLVSAD